jgi:hypothetical protein
MLMLLAPFLGLLGSIIPQIIGLFHKKEDNTLINIIEVEYDKEFMDYIFEHLLVFSIFFMNFLNDNIAKINLLKNKDEIIIKV